MSDSFLNEEGLSRYDQLMKGITGGSLSKSEDGTKLILKSVDGTVLSEVDAPSGGGSGNAIPKTGNRGLLAGYNTCHLITSDDGPVEITIDENSPDDMSICQGANTITLNITAESNSAYVKNIFLYCAPEMVTVNFGEGAFVDDFYLNGFVNDLGLSMVNQIVVTNYLMDDGEYGVAPFVLVSNKVII